MNAETPRAPSISWSVRAKRTNVPACSPVVMNCFVPGDAPAVSVRHRGRPQRPGVGARARLGERERADLLAARERRHEPLALLLRAEREDRQRAGARVHRHRDADARVRARELLEHEDVGEEVGARAAELGGHADAHQPELGELRVELRREAVLAVPGGGVRLDLGLRELTRQRLDLPLVVRQGEVHGRKLTRRPGTPGGSRAATCSRSQKASTTSGSNCLPLSATISCRQARQLRASR